MTRRAATTIPLDRVFLQVPESASGLDAEAISSAAWLFNRPESWPEVLRHPYVVVLGEAGTGKSTEFRQQAKELTANQHFAVFVELVDLATGGLAASIDPEDNARLEEWRHGDGPGVFFLDSLDEAKLRQRTLRQALRRLRHELTKEWARVQLVISCRASDWMAEADRAEVQAVVPDGSEAGVHVVQLAPLKSTQVEKLAAHAGVVDAPRFIRAVNDNYAHVFIERPLDVQWLGGYWARHERIGSLRELVADNIREKLKERPGRSTTLALTKAETGLRALAGIATINNCWSFLVPDEPLDVQRAAGAVDPQDVLPNWSADEIHELLRRSIFDESTYGRVRLHHRTVQEFLAAQWLASLSAAGLARNSLEELLFRREADDTAIPMHLGPVAAWLALWDQELREKLITEAPALLIGHGDPAGLTPDERQRTLRAYSREYEDRPRRFDRFDHASLRRFSSPVLADQVAALLADPGTPDELCATLLQLVQLGQIGACSAVALELALDQKRSGRVRFFAIRAAAAVGTDEHRRALLSLVATTDRWEQDVAGAFVRALYPEPLDVSGLLDVLSKAAPKRRNLTTSLQVVLEYEIPKLGDTDLRLRLLRGLLEKMRRNEESGDGGVPSDRQWLLPMIGKLVSSILDDLPDAEPHPAEVVSALELFRWCRAHYISYGLEDVKKAVARHPEIRRMLFWRRVEAHRQRKGVTPTRYQRFSYEIFDLSVADESWLALDASSRGDVRERLLAFDALARLPRAEDTQQERLSLLGEVAATSPDLTKRLNRMLNPPVDLSSLNHQEDRAWRARELAREKRNQRNRAALEARIGGIRDGTDVNTLWFLFEQAEHGHNAYGEVSEDALRHRFGDEIVDAAVTGWRAFWRSFDPPLPHERERRNTTPRGVMLGLIGLHKDFSMGLEAASLRPEEARLAARYAACELNSFPAWLTHLARTYPNVVV